MSDRMYLVGAEEVQSASHRMQSAAHDMQNAAQRMENALHLHQQFLEGWLDRFREILKPEEDTP